MNTVEEFQTTTGYTWKQWRRMICECPFHEGQSITVGYRHDRPTEGKPLCGSHGLVCLPCGRFYGAVAPYTYPIRYPFTLAMYMAALLNPKSILLPSESVPHVEKSYNVVILPSATRSRMAA